MGDAKGLLTFYSSLGLDSAIESVAGYRGSIEGALTICNSIAANETAVHLRAWEFGTDKPELRLSDDGEASVQIHQYLGEMAPDQASDRRLWSYLAAVEFGQYTGRRWRGTQKEITGKFITDRVLIGNSNLTRLSRNSIARLWYAADRLTDISLQFPLSSKTGDPYAYTRAVMAKQDRHTSLFQRTLVHNSELIRAVIDHLESHQVRAESDYMQALAKELYLRMGFQQLEVLSYDEVAEFVSTAGAHLRR